MPFGPGQHGQQTLSKEQLYYHLCELEPELLHGLENKATKQL